MKFPDPRYNVKMAVVIVVAFILLTLLSFSVISVYKTGEEATVGIFSLAVTLLGTIFIAVELRNSQNVTCSEMLINLNNYFHDSERLMKVYAALERCEMEGKTEPAYFKDIASVEIAHYCTFFENFYLLYRHHVAEIEDLDDLFGYRFFIFANNPYIQEHYILPTASSYVQILKLYKVWAKYRQETGGKDWRKQIPMDQYHWPKGYIDRKLYMVDAYAKNECLDHFEAKGRSFRLERLGCKDLSAIMDLQQKCVDSLPNADLYSPLTRGELIESVCLDTLVGVYANGNELVAVAIIVSNRDSDRNLSVDIGEAPASVITFDAVFVDPAWRGYGIQKTLIDWSICQAAEQGAAKIATTVSPENTYSERNFTSRGFKITAQATKYGGLPRNILVYTNRVNG